MTPPDNVIPLPLRTKPSRWILYLGEGSEWFLDMLDFTLRVDTKNVGQVCADASVLADVYGRLDPAIIEEADAMFADAPDAALALPGSALLKEAAGKERLAVARLLG